MFTSIVSTTALLLAALATAQTPPGFSPTVNAKLELMFASKSVATPGQALTKADTAKQPTLGTSDAALTGTYLWMMIGTAASPLQCNDPDRWLINSQIRMCMPFTKLKSTPLIFCIDS